MRPPRQSLLDTTPAWLSLTLVSTSAALVVSGLGIFFGFAATWVISPFSLLLHLVWAVTVSAGALNLRMNLAPERKALLSMGVAVAVGSVWSSIQQWLAYVGTGLVNDLVLLATSIMMDVSGGAVTYILFHLNMLRK